MEQFIRGIGLSVIAFGAVMIGACVTGTLVWVLWDDVIPYFFQSAVANGLPSDPSWWMCVLLTWLTSVLFKASTSTSKD